VRPTGHSPESGSVEVSHRPAELLDADWVRRVRFGALLIFWTTLATPILANLTGFLGPFIAPGINSVTYMKWVHLIPTIAGWPFLIAVFALTKPWPSTHSCQPGDRLRRFLRVLVCLEVSHRFARTVSEFAYDITDAVWFALPGRVVDMCGVLLSLIYLMLLCRWFGIHAIARSYRTLAVCYVALMAADCALGLALDHLIPPDDWRYWVWGDALVALAIWIWGLVLLRKFAGHLTRGLEGRCIACGYSLRGLPEPRCPECGQALQVQPTPESGWP